MTQQLKYIAQKEVYEVDICEHPLCERLHKYNCPMVTRTEWVIVDSVTGERPWLYSGTYDLKRDTKAHLQILNA